MTRSRTTTPSRTAAAVDELGAVNEVRLRGRLAAASTEIPLPSGDIACVFRLVVERAPDRRRGPSVRVDTLECKVYAADLRRRIARFAPGDVLEVHGSLQRRFFRAGGMAASRYDVVVTAAARVARAAAAQRATMAG
jgi:single-strand DNA-binding protein